MFALALLIAALAPPSGVATQPFRPLEAEQEPPKVERQGWVFTEEVDAMTDQRTVKASMETPEGRLTVGCDGRLFMVLSTVAYLGAGEAEIERNLIFRVDGRPLYSRPGRWNYSSNAAENRTGVAEMVARWRGGESVLVRASTFDQRDVDVRFSLEGATPVLDRVFAACGTVVPTATPAS